LKSITPAAIAIADMFRYPTIATLANFLNRAPGQSAGLDKLQERIAKQRQADPSRHENRNAL
jgi:hypothetical protein